MSDELGKGLLAALWKANPDGKPLPTWADCREDAKDELRRAAEHFVAFLASRPDTPARPDREAVEKVLREHIKVDAAGLAPAVSSAFVTGIDEAASAVLALLPPADGWRSIDTAPRDNTFKPDGPLPYFCPACESVPRHGYCNMKGCPTAPPAAVGDE